MKLCHAHTCFHLLCIFLYVVVKAIRSFCMESNLCKQLVFK